MLKNKIKTIFSENNLLFGFSFNFWIIVVLLVLMKVWLISGQSLYAIGSAGYDDRLFINLANNLLHFHWLGDFSNLTLVKGPFYPIWIAFSYLIHVPLFFSQHLLYIFACIILVISLRSLSEKNWPFLIIFTVILFNPVSFTDGPATRVIREGIYPALTILVVALFSGMLLRAKNSLKNIFYWSLGAGIVLSCFWLTREEGIWIMPLVVLIILYSVFITWKAKGDYWKKKIILLLSPFFLLFASITIVSIINYSEYGIFNTVEFKDPSFLGAYGALTRVKGPVWIADVPVPSAQRQIIYSISPSFVELKSFMEGVTWAISASQTDDYKGGWFIWVFRDAVAQAGYYRSGEVATNYYNKLANEINSACLEKKIICLEQNATLMSPWNKNYNIPTLISIYHGLLYTITLDDFNAKPSESVGDKASIELFDMITRGGVTAKNDLFKISILNNIGKSYALILPIVTIMAFLIFLFQLVRIKRSYKEVKFVLSFSIAASVFALIVGLALINVTSFPAINIYYLSPLYPLFFLFVLLNFFVLFDYLRFPKSRLR